MPTRPPSTRWGLRRGLWLIPVTAVLALSLPKLGQGEFSVDTGWYGAIALQAYRAAASGDPSALWSLPGIGGPEAGIPYFNKPPLGFWLNGLPLWAAGPTVWAARIGSVLGACACVALTALVARDAGRRSAGLAAGLILALTIPLLTAARSFSLDIWLVACLVGSIWPAAVAFRTGRPRLLWLTGLGVGLGLMVKPLLALLVLPILAIWLAWTGRARWCMYLVPAVAAALLVAAPWHVSMVALHGDAFTNQYFGSEIADRAAGGAGSTTLNADASDPFYYAKPLLEHAWPWLLTTFLAAAMFARLLWSSGGRAARLGAARSHPAAPWLKLGIVWTIVWLVVLSVFPDKRPRYLLPLFPVWAWMSAIWLTSGRWRGTEWGAPAPARRFWQRWSQGGAWLALPILGAVLAAAPLRFHGAEGEHWLSLYEWLESQGHPPLYQGAFVGQRAARLYLRTGRWPLPTHNNAGERIAEPLPGSLIIYHNRDGLAPGPNETAVFAAERLRVTRLESGRWNPRPAPDPGE